MLKRAISYYYFFICLSLLCIGSTQADEGALATKEMLSYTCAGCHGPNGASVGPATPIIGGQPENYLISVLLGYKYYGKQEELDKLMEKPEFEDFEMFPRYGIIMSRLMAGYSVDEIKLIAKYFASQEWRPVKQTTDSAMVGSGKKLHESACEKCHEDGGASDIDDISIIAGQWTPYLQHVMDDYHQGRSGMPKKMKQKMKSVYEKYGDPGMQKLVQFYTAR